MAKYFCDFVSTFPKPRFEGGNTLTETRINACKVAKQYEKQRIGIYLRHGTRETGWRGSEFKEYIEYYSKTNGYYLVQWSTNRMYSRVSPKTGKLLDMNKY